MDILAKIKAAGLVGRGGAAFPTHLKWAAVKSPGTCEVVAEHVFCDLKASDISGGKKCYIVVNAAEGEPGVLKDGYILEHHADEVIHGVSLAFKYLKANMIYFYINPLYYESYQKLILRAVKKYGLLKTFSFVIKPEDAGYIGGEETAILNLIEGNRLEPRLRPPYPTKYGLFGYPTLINNVETFYNVSLVDKGKYQHERFYTISGKGVFKFPEDHNIEDILFKTNSYPDVDFFVQVGGDASGEVLNSKQLDRPVGGAGSIMIHKLAKHSPQQLLMYWLKFYQQNSCGQCTTCREGTYRLLEMLKTESVDWDLFWELIDNLEHNSFCALGAALPLPIRSYFTNIFKLWQ
jgi:NADH:ubiquinone oxidoreductase subunit F (NADH-binding)